MTDRDVLKRAAEALRETSEPSPEELLKLRQRVLGGAKVLPLSGARKNKAVRWALPLAAAFIAGSALAATPGAWEGMLHTVERFLDVELLAPSHEYAPSARGGKRAHPQPKRDVAPAPASMAEAAAPAAPEPTTPETPAAPEGIPTPIAQAPRASAPAPSRVQKPRAAAAEPTREPAPPIKAAEAEQEVAEVDAKVDATRAPSRDLTLYNKAHELHFRARRYDEALRAWEVYLAQTPAPTFALEARYNRALCLLRLGHFEEARAALRPFAEGRVLGAYRREEATHLIQALDKRR